jgi:hypothetical protein
LKTATNSAAKVAELIKSMAVLEAGQGFGEKNERAQRGYFQTIPLALIAHNQSV